MGKQKKVSYKKPELKRNDNMRDITFDQPNWQCSVANNNGVGNNGCDNGNHYGRRR